MRQTAGFFISIMSHKDYFRNRISFKDIEPDSLWELKDGFFLLADDDDIERVSFEEAKEDFYPVPDPFPSGYHSKDKN